MNLHSLASTMNPGRAAHAHGLAYPDGRAVSVLRFPAWLADGFAIARTHPLWWLAAILACADYATLLELAPPLRLFATLIVPVVMGGLMLMQERTRNARPWTLAETFEAVGGHRNALSAVGLTGAALAGIGYLAPLAVFHTTVAASVAANGAHHLSIVYGVHNGASNALEPLVSVPFYAVAVSAVWFAPALVVLHNLSPVEALATSLRAMLRNWPVALVYAAAIAADALLAPVLPMLARGLVVTPLVSALIVMSMYGCYRDVFGAR
ncbi:BPSS1780 family membrane protein [Paraburkholderia phosphatilytica]|uniref:BPSS1780 family membrane protein n=1 Tax=Paraburkholderia phosphatilytica TaxID=2282883 RepID=UPI000E54ACB8|nr:BPSS1780 family membrane protein [Paraburkholderia phosphatilytica]